tara:strand:- start:480 stop:905 length:426 start_codon:yes stop_codon:yes gene_type:complete
VSRKIKFSRVIQACPEDVFNQISKFENYTLFIPGCSKAKLIEKNDKFEIGELEFEFLHKKYYIKSRNLISNNHIKIEQIKGPFRLFDCSWKITSNDVNVTEIFFEAEFELPFLLDNLLPDKIINNFCDILVNAFIKRVVKK